MLWSPFKVELDQGVRPNSLLVRRLESWNMKVRILVEIDRLCHALLKGLLDALDGKLYGLYVYGAATFPETSATGDVDFHAILTAELTEGERLAILDLHRNLARDYPPLGAELDGYYLLLEDARQTSPPAHQLRPEIRDNSWALHRAHILAGRCIVLFGPDPVTIYPPATWDELEQALWGELDYVEEHLVDYPAFCILNLCRLMYSSETRDVVTSKAAAGAWAWDAFPQYRRLIDAARRSYAGQASQIDDQFMLSGVNELFRFARQRIDQSLTCTQPSSKPGVE